MIIHDPKNHMKIDAVWVFISQDEDGNEGIVATSVPIKNGTMMLPLVAADEARLQDLKKISKEIERKTKKKIKLIKFTTREDLENIT